MLACSPVFDAVFKTRTDREIDDRKMIIDAMKLFVVLLYLASVLHGSVIINGLGNAVVSHFDELVAVASDSRFPSWIASSPNSWPGC